jgi:restriction system protein
MAIPDYQTVMLPLLRLLADEREHSLGEAVEALSDGFRLSPQERQKLLPSGAYPVMRSRVGWAKTCATRSPTSC